MVNFDYDSIKTRIINNLRSRASWAQILPDSTNMRIVEAFSEEEQDLANYTEYLVNETKWSLARNASSLLSAESIHRYRAHRKIGAQGFIRIGISSLITSANWAVTTAYKTGDTIYYLDILYTANINTTGNQPNISPTQWSLTNIAPPVNVDIPKWTVFTDQAGNIKFCSYTANTLTTGQNFIDIPVIQGTPKSYSVIAQGLIKEEIILNDPSIENTIYELYNNNILWTNVISLLDQIGTTTAYEIENILDFSGIYLKFGDNTNGKQLTTGDSIVYKYVATDGITYNITSSNIINKISYTLYDTNGSAVTAYCTNIDSLLGGIDYETVNSIRLNAPKIFQTGDRASSINDYKAIIEQNFSFVLKSNVWGSYEHNIDLGVDPWTFINSDENVVNVAAISTAGTNLTSAQKLLISQGINSYKAPTDIVVYNSVRFLNLVFVSSLYISNTLYTLTSVVSNVTNALSSNYSVTALDLFQNIYFSDYQTLIDSAAGVDHHTTYAQIYYDFLFNNAYTMSLTLPSINIRPSSISVYIEDTVAAPGVFTYIAYDDGAGHFTAKPGYTLTNSSISYSTGLGTIQVATGLSNPYQNYVIRVKYRLVSDDLILQYRTDIFKVDTATSQITAQYVRQ
jgi:hypothetical protein